MTLDDIAAMEPGREADAFIHCFVEWGEWPRGLQIARDEGGIVWLTPGNEFEGYDERDWVELLDVPHFTTSLDAKLPCENIIAATYSDHGDGTKVWEAHHQNPKTKAITIGQHQSGEAFARRIAVLRAREAG